MNATEILAALLAPSLGAATGGGPGAGLGGLGSGGVPIEAGFPGRTTVVKGGRAVDVDSSGKEIPSAIQSGLGAGLAVGGLGAPSLGLASSGAGSDGNYGAQPNAATGLGAPLPNATSSAAGFKPNYDLTPPGYSAPSLGSGLPHLGDVGPSVPSALKDQPQYPAGKSVDELGQHARELFDLVQSSQGDLKKALQDLIIQAHAPPQTKKTTLVTKDLAWAVPALIAAFSGRGGQEFAGGLLQGAMQGKQADADRQNADNMKQWEFGKNQLKLKADVAQQNVQMALQNLQTYFNEEYRKATLRQKDDAGEKKEVSALQKQLFDPKTAPEAIPGLVQALAGYGVVYGPDLVKSLQSGNYYTRNKEADTSLKGAKTTTENETRPGKVAKLGSEVDLLKQKFGFYKEYNPELINRIRAQVKGIVSKNALTDEQKALIHERVEALPLDQQAKRANIYSTIASRQAHGAGGATAKEEQQLYKMNEAALKGFSKRQRDFLQRNPLTPEELKAAQDMENWNSDYRARMQAQIEKERASTAGNGGSAMPQSQIGKSGGFAPYQPVKLTNKELGEMNAYRKRVHDAGIMRPDLKQGLIDAFNRKYQSKGIRY